MNYIFYLESYIFLFIKKEEILLYNSTTGKSFKFCANEKLVHVLTPLLQMENMYSICISEEERLDPSINHFIDTVRESFWGDLIPVSLVGSKPVIFPPILNFQKKKDRNVFASSDNILQLMTNLNMYVLNYGSNQNRLASKNSFRQYLTSISGSSKELLPFETIKSIVKEIEVLNVCVNILGGNILQYPHIDDLQRLLSGFKRVNYYLYYRDLCDAIENGHALNCKIHYIILADASIQPSSLNTILNFSAKESVDLSWNFFVEDENEFDAIEQMVEKTGMEGYEVFPLLADNVFFFEENIFIDEEELLTNNISKREIFAHQTINTTDFGKITVLPDGSVYGNVNLPSIGSLSRSSLHELIHKELSEGESWFRIREKEPCSGCVYQWLCPTPSNFELILNKPNTCKFRN